jgi:hypothetical protein
MLPLPLLLLLLLLLGCWPSHVHPHAEVCVFHDAQPGVKPANGAEVVRTAEHGLITYTVAAAAAAAAAATAYTVQVAKNKCQKQVHKRVGTPKIILMVSQLQVFC